MKILKMWNQVTKIHQSLVCFIGITCKSNKRNRKDTQSPTTGLQQATMGLKAPLVGGGTEGVCWWPCIVHNIRLLPTIVAIYNSIPPRLLFVKKSGLFEGEMNEQPRAWGGVEYVTMKNKTTKVLLSQFEANTSVAKWSNEVIMLFQELLVFDGKHQLDLSTTT
jgi:hypothetical protein